MTSQFQYGYFGEAPFVAALEDDPDEPFVAGMSLRRGSVDDTLFGQGQVELGLRIWVSSLPADVSLVGNILGLTTDFTLTGEQGLVMQSLSDLVARAMMMPSGALELARQQSIEAARQALPVETSKSIGHEWFGCRGSGLFGSNQFAAAGESAATIADTIRKLVTQRSIAFSFNKPIEPADELELAIGSSSPIVALPARLLDYRYTIRPFANGVGFGYLVRGVVPEHAKLVGELVARRLTLRLVDMQGIAANVLSRSTAFGTNDVEVVHTIEAPTAATADVVRAVEETLSDLCATPSGADVDALGDRADATLNQQQVQAVNALVRSSSTVPPLEHTLGALDPAAVGQLLRDSIESRLYLISDLATDQVDRSQLHVPDTSELRGRRFNVRTPGKTLGVKSRFTVSTAGVSLQMPGTKARLETAEIEAIVAGGDGWYRFVASTGKDLVIRPRALIVPPWRRQDAEQSIRQLLGDVALIEIPLSPREQLAADESTKAKQRRARFRIAMPLVAAALVAIILVLPRGKSEDSGGTSTTPSQLRIQTHALGEAGTDGDLSVVVVNSAVVTQESSAGTLSYLVADVQSCASASASQPISSAQLGAFRFRTTDNQAVPAVFVTLRTGSVALPVVTLGAGECNKGSIAFVVTGKPTTGFIAYTGIATPDENRWTVG